VQFGRKDKKRKKVSVLPLEALASAAVEVEVAAD
jgi:hypothetical protein